MSTRGSFVWLAAFSMLACTYPFGDVVLDGSGGSGAGSGGQTTTSTSTTNPNGGSGLGGDPLTGGGASGAGGANGGAGVGGEGGEGGVAGELCSNGVDDDGDTLVDCEDAGCEGFACGAPTGWLGPVYYALGSGPDDMPVCPNMDPAIERGWVTFADGDVTCSTCSCTTTAACAFASFNTDTTCDPVPTPLPRDMCVTITPVANFVGATVSGLVSTCQPSAVETTFPANGDAAALCPIDCPAGDCIAGTTPVGLKGPCVYADDSALACPSGYPLLVQLERAAFTDSRGCSGCGCALPNSCDGLLRTYTDAACDPASLQTQEATGTCVEAPQATPTRAIFTPNGLAGSCAPGGGDPVGSVQKKSFDVCCAP